MSRASPPPPCLVIDVLTGAAFVLTVWRQAVWREILPLAVSALVAAQFGSFILQYADPILLRWGITVRRAGGGRRCSPPAGVITDDRFLLVTLGVGALSGLLGGAMQIAGPPVIVYWLGSASDACIVRANFICLFRHARFRAVGSPIRITGLLTGETTALALLIGPPHIIGQYVGPRLFHVASEQYLSPRRVRGHHARQRCSACPCSTAGCAEAATAIISARPASGSFAWHPRQAAAAAAPSSSAARCRAFQRRVPAPDRLGGRRVRALAGRAGRPRRRNHHPSRIAGGA